ncbi:Meiotic Sister-Chromatid recombination aldehyde dehydrogenase [Toensbergia leucococca]|nr:Meiotic Sister-Chromatid recombination aldehyde dehydrogenase [Toensbergia leucococca]
MGPIISTLFAGSALIIKGSEQTAWSLSYFASIARIALSACGHSPHLVQPLVCWPSQASHLTSHPGISHITFIGSRPVAHAVCASASKSLTPVCVELGGKDPAIVLDDVRGIEKAASILMRGIFQSSGQNCIGIERIIALPRSYARLLSILEPRIRRLRVGSSLDQLESVDIGAMISNVTFDRLEQIIADAVRQGARCLVGGKRYTHPKFPRGHYFSPTLVVDVTPSMRLAQEEVFGPICVIMAAASVDDAIAIANSTSYALGAAVFGSDRKALDRVISGVRAGMVSVNDFAVFYAVQLPFGGVGGSGYGRFAGEEGLRGLCNVKSVCRDRFPRLASTAIPRALDYPVGERGRGDEVCKGIVRLGYGIGWVERVRGLWGVMRNG